LEASALDLGAAEGMMSAVHEFTVTQFAVFEFHDFINEMSDFVGSSVKFKVVVDIESEDEC
jgi:hypothetical protein